MDVRKAFTPRTVESLKPNARRREVPDPGCRGLYLVIQPTGKKSWAWRSKHPVSGKPIKRTLGDYPAFSLREAHDWAREHTKFRELGIDLQESKRAEAARLEREKLEAGGRATKTLQWYWEIYAPEFVTPLRDSYETERMYTKFLKPTLGRKALLDITHEDFAAVISSVRKHAPVTANRLTTMIKTMWRRALTHFRTQSGLRINVTEFLVKPTREVKRDRTLDRIDLGYVLAVLDNHVSADYVSTYCKAVRLIIWTGVRLREALDATWEEFDLKAGTWLIPGSRTKNKLELLLDLPPKLIAWLKDLKGDTKARHLFYSVTKPDRPITCYSKPQAIIFGETVALARADGRTIARWSPHDLRRTFNTMISGISDKRLNARVQPIVVEALLNHISGYKAGVAGIYNRYQYRPEKQRALRLWQVELEGISADHKCRASQRTKAQAGVSEG